MTRLKKLCERAILPLAILGLALVGAEVYPPLGAGILVGAIFEARVLRERRRRLEDERRWRLREAAWRHEQMLVEPKFTHIPPDVAKRQQRVYAKLLSP